MVFLSKWARSPETTVAACCSSADAEVSSHGQAVWLCQHRAQCRLICLAVLLQQSICFWLPGWRQLRDLYTWTQTAILLLVSKNSLWTRYSWWSCDVGQGAISSDTPSAKFCTLLFCKSVWKFRRKGKNQVLSFFTFTFTVSLKKYNVIKPEHLKWRCLDQVVWESNCICGVRCGTSLQNFILMLSGLIDPKRTL